MPKEAEGGTRNRRSSIDAWPLVAVCRRIRAHETRREATVKNYWKQISHPPLLWGSHPRRRSDPSSRRRDCPRRASSQRRRRRRARTSTRRGGGAVGPFSRAARRADGRLRRRAADARARRRRLRRGRGRARARGAGLPNKARRRARRPSGIEKRARRSWLSASVRNTTPAVRRCKDYETWASSLRVRSRARRWCGRLRPTTKLRLTWRFCFGPHGREHFIEVYASLRSGKREVRLDRRSLRSEPKGPLNFEWELPGHDFAVAEDEGVAAAAEDDAGRPRRAEIVSIRL